MQDERTVWQKIAVARLNHLDTVCIVFVTPNEAARLLLINGEREGIGISQVMDLPQQALRDLNMVENLNGKRGHYAVHQFTARAFRWLEFCLRENDEIWFDIVTNVRKHRNGAWRDDLRKIADPVWVEAVLKDYETERANRLANRRT